MLILIFVTAVICLNSSVGHNIPRSGSESEINSPWNTTSLDTHHGYLQQKPKLCQEYSELFHRETKKCYIWDSQGPCPDMMEFRFNFSSSNPYYIPYLSYGVCLCKSPTCEGRPVVLWEPTKKCFHAYQQGPCPKGQWLVINNKTVECEKNPCLHTPGTNNFEYIPETPFWFPHNGECYKTNTTAFCTNKDDIVTFATSPDNQKYYCTSLDECGSYHLNLPASGYDPSVLGCSYGEPTSKTGCEPPAPVDPEAEN